MGCYALLQKIFPTQGSNPGLPHCRQILYHLSYQGSARILKWYLSPEDLLDPGIEPGSPALQADSLPAELPGKPQIDNRYKNKRSMFTVHQFSSVAQSCPTLCDPMNRSTPGLHVHHQLPEFTQTHIHRVSNAIQPSHPLASPSPPAPNPSQHQSLFQ